ncbi:MAG: fused MFS/spermidine synthase [Planctomycetes bacterium]|nr:fused MFS/spermidine synthase [Planctomycetota bacterium]
MPFLFSLTLFCNAFLLFQVQPIVGKMLLPKLGGTPAVWNTCMVFFQAALLAGYAYAHATSKWLGSRRASLLHLVVLLFPLIVLPVVIGDDAFRSSAATDNPVLLVLGQLALAVGLPFFVVSTTAPLLQRWFADTGHPSAHDPYFLYAASNLGSMLSLLAYPILVEPQLALDRQSWFWMWGYVLCALLVGICAMTLRGKPQTQPEASVSNPPATPETLTWKRRLRWIFLAFVPSSLLLGCTTYISTDLAPIPLLWIVPLALYLLTFIIVFAKRPWIPHELSCRILPISVLVLTLLLVLGANQIRGLPFWALLLVHLLALFLTALVAHGELARDRPHTEHLTEFFLWMSVGGMLGGMFNALLAPVIFQRTGLTEYPLALVLACLIRPTPKSVSRFDAWDGLLPCLIGVLAVGMWFLTRALDLEPGPVRNGLVFGVPGLLVFTFADRVVRFGLGIAVLFLVSAINVDDKQLTLERNFFGVVRVVETHSSDGIRFRQMIHGNTLHGQMSLDSVDADGRHEPLTYYHRTGPIGVVCEKWAGSKPGRVSVGAVGLGTGSLAYYARPGDEWSFYEIDPAIERIAADSRYFSFLSECRAARSGVILGDAYLRLQEAPEGSFDLLVLDAFSSDSIPVHLMTREAVALYRSRLKPGGLMAFHISNRYLNLRPILAKLAEDAGFVARVWRDSPTDEQKKLGKTESAWVIMAAREEDFGALVGSNSRWERIEARPDTPLWTNNFSNLLSALGR